MSTAVGGIGDISGISGIVVRDAESRVRFAWRRDLYEMRRLVDRQLQAAVADSLQAYEVLRRAQQDSAPGRIADAHLRFETATRLTQARTDDRDRIDALIEADFGGGSATFATSATSAAPPSPARLARVRRLAATLRRRS
jgi:hypothetical protein